MTRRYTNLGAVPSVAGRSAERRDLLLAHTGTAARRLLRAVKKRPRKDQVAVLNRALKAIDPSLPAEVNRVADFLNRQGMKTDRAVERALSLALADAVVERAKTAGRRYQRGAGYPMAGWGMGGLGDEAGDIVGASVQGLFCSTGVRDAAAEMVGRQEGADAAGATTLGFELLRGMSQCPAGTTEVPPPPPSEPVEQDSLLVPVLVGAGALALAGGAFWLFTRKK